MTFDRFRRGAAPSPEPQTDPPRPPKPRPPPPERIAAAPASPDRRSHPRGRRSPPGASCARRRPRSPANRRRRHARPRPPRPRGGPPRPRPRIARRSQQRRRDGDGPRRARRVRRAGRRRLRQQRAGAPELCLLLRVGLPERQRRARLGQGHRRRPAQQRRHPGQHQRRRRPGVHHRRHRRSGPEQCQAGRLQRRPLAHRQRPGQAARVPPGPQRRHRRRHCALRVRAGRRRPRPGIRHRDAVSVRARAAQQVLDPAGAAQGGQPVADPGVRAHRGRERVQHLRQVGLWPQQRPQDVRHRLLPRLRLRPLAPPAPAPAAGPVAPAPAAVAAPRVHRRPLRRWRRHLLPRGPVLLAVRVLRQRRPVLRQLPIHVLLRQLLRRPPAQPSSPAAPAAAAELQRPLRRRLRRRQVRRPVGPGMLLDVRVVRGQEGPLRSRELPGHVRKVLGQRLVGTQALNAAGPGIHRPVASVSGLLLWYLCYAASCMWEHLIRRTGARRVRVREGVRVRGRHARNRRPDPAPMQSLPYGWSNQKACAGQSTGDDFRLMQLPVDHHAGLNGPETPPDTAVRDVNKPTRRPDLRLFRRHVVLLPRSHDSYASALLGRSHFLGLGRAGPAHGRVLPRRARVGPLRPALPRRAARHVPGRRARRRRKEAAARPLGLARAHAARRPPAARVAGRPACLRPAVLPAGRRARHRRGEEAARGRAGKGPRRPAGGLPVPRQQAAADGPAGRGGRELRGPRVRVPQVPVARAVEGAVEGVRRARRRVAGVPHGAGRDPGGDGVRRQAEVVGGAGVDPRGGGQEVAPRAGGGKGREGGVRGEPDPDGSEDPAGMSSPTSFSAARANTTIQHPATGST